MELATTFAIGRFVLSFFLAIGGILSIFYGYKLFVNGAGLKKAADRFTIKNREFTISWVGMSAGGFLMVTAAAWGYFAMSSAPRLDYASDGTTKIVDPWRGSRSIVAKGPWSPNGRTAFYIVRNPDTGRCTVAEEPPQSTSFTIVGGLNKLEATEAEAQKAMLSLKACEP
jgi:hypothetical protein